MADNVFWGVHGALQAGANATVLMLGDSWFWYPVDNLAIELGARYRTRHTFVVIGSNGAEAAEWAGRFRKDIDFGFSMFAEGAEALMLSGGGNDIAGMRDFLRLLNDDCSGTATVADCFRIAQPGALLETILGAYRAVITKFRARNAAAPVILHHYDYAWPTGAGFFGPGDWLKEPMDRARVPEALRRPLLKDLIDRLAAAQRTLAADAAFGPVHVAATAGVLPDTEAIWANELHPTPKGFRLLVRKAFVPAFKAAGIG